MIHEQIAQDVFDKLERERGVFHYNDKEELIRRFAQALLDAETRGLANGTLCTVPAKDLPTGGDYYTRADVEAAMPNNEECVEALQRWLLGKQTDKQESPFFAACIWFRSELLSRLGGNKK